MEMQNRGKIDDASYFQSHHDRKIGKGTPIATSIVGSSRLLCEGLFALLSQHLTLQLVDTYVGEFSSDLSTPNPLGHVVLVDSSIGHETALAWTRHWHTLTPSANVLVLELPNDQELIMAFIEAGANGYLFQGASATQVAKAIKDADSGIAYCTPEITAKLFARLASQKTVMPPPQNLLTVREIEVLYYVSRGFSNREIASQLVIDLRTVKQHVHHILDKLKVRSRWQAGQFAEERGWLRADETSPSSR